MEVRPLQPEKADMPMEVTLSGMMVLLHPLINEFVDVSIMALQLLWESNFILSLSTIIELKPLHPEKARSPIKVTLLGMVIEVKLIQSTNAL